MDNTNTVKNGPNDTAVKCLSKNKEYRETQVFVLPPEFLKGLIHDHSSSKVKIETASLKKLVTKENISLKSTTEPQSTSEIKTKKCTEDDTKLKTTSVENNEAKQDCTKSFVTVDSTTIPKSVDNISDELKGEIQSETMSSNLLKKNETLSNLEFNQDFVITQKKLSNTSIDISAVNKQNKSLNDSIKDDHIKNHITDNHVIKSEKIVFENREQYHNKILPSSQKKTLKQLPQAEKNNIDDKVKVEKNKNIKKCLILKVEDLNPQNAIEYPDIAYTKHISKYYNLKESTKTIEIGKNERNFNLCQRNQNETLGSNVKADIEKNPDDINILNKKDNAILDLYNTKINENNGFLEKQLNTIHNSNDQLLYIEEIAEIQSAINNNEETEIIEEIEFIIEENTENDDMNKEESLGEVEIFDIIGRIRMKDDTLKKVDIIRNDKSINKKESLENINSFATVQIYKKDETSKKKDIRETHNIISKEELLVEDKSFDTINQIYNKDDTSEKNDNTENDDISKKESVGQMKNFNTVSQIYRKGDTSEKKDITENNNSVTKELLGEAKILDTISQIYKKNDISETKDKTENNDITKEESVRQVNIFYTVGQIYKKDNSFENKVITKKDNSITKEELFGEAKSFDTFGQIYKKNDTSKKRDNTENDDINKKETIRQVEICDTVAQFSMKDTLEKEDISENDNIISKEELLGDAKSFATADQIYKKNDTSEERDNKENDDISIEKSDRQVGTFDPIGQIFKNDDTSEQRDIAENDNSISKKELLGEANSFYTVGQIYKKDNSSENKDITENDNNISKRELLGEAKIFDNIGQIYKKNDTSKTKDKTENNEISKEESVSQADIFYTVGQICKKDNSSENKNITENDNSITKEELFGEAKSFNTFGEIYKKNDTSKKRDNTENDDINKKESVRQVEICDTVAQFSMKGALEKEDISENDNTISKEELLGDAKSFSTADQIYKKNNTSEKRDNKENDDISIEKSDEQVGTFDPIGQILKNDDTSKKRDIAENDNSISKKELFGDTNSFDTVGQIYKKDNSSEKKFITENDNSITKEEFFGEAKSFDIVSQIYKKDTRSEKTHNMEKANSTSKQESFREVTICNIIDQINKKDEINNVDHIYKSNKRHNVHKTKYNFVEPKLIFNDKSISKEINIKSDKNSKKYDKQLETSSTVVSDDNKKRCFINTRNIERDSTTKLLNISSNLEEVPKKRKFEIEEPLSSEAEKIQKRRYRPFKGRSDNQISTEKDSNLSIANRSSSLSIVDTYNQNIEIKVNAEEALINEVKEIQKRGGRRSKSNLDNEINAKKSPHGNLCVTDTWDKLVENKVVIEEPLSNELKKIQKRRGRPSKVKRDNQIPNEHSATASIIKRDCSLSNVDNCNQNLENQVGIEEQLCNELTKMKKGRGRPSKVKHDNQIPTEHSAAARITKTDSNLTIVDNCNQNDENKVEIGVQLSNEVKILQKRRGRSSRVNPENQIPIEHSATASITKRDSSLSIIGTCNQKIENEVGIKGQLSNELTKIKKGRGRPSKVKHNNQIPIENSAIASNPKTDSNLTIADNCNQNTENKVEIEVPLSIEVKILQKKRGRLSRVNPDNHISSEEGINPSVAQTHNSLSIIDTCNQNIENEGNMEDPLQITSVDDKILNKKFNQSLNITFNADITTISESLMNSIVIKERISNECTKIKKGRGRPSKVKHNNQIPIENSAIASNPKTDSNLTIADNCNQNTENKVEIEVPLSNEVKILQKKRGRLSRVNPDNHISSEEGINPSVAQTHNSLSIIDTCNQNIENEGNMEDPLQITSVDDKILNKKFNQSLNITFNADITTISESLMNSIVIKERISNECTKIKKGRGRPSKVKHNNQIPIENSAIASNPKTDSNLTIADNCNQNTENKDFTEEVPKFSSADNILKEKFNETLNIHVDDITTTADKHLVNTVEIGVPLSNEVKILQKRRGRPSRVNPDNQIPTEHRATASITKRDSSLYIIDTCNQNIENKDVTEEVPEVSPGDNILKDKLNESLSIQVDDIATTANEHFVNTVEFEVPLSNEVKILEKKKGRPSRFNSDNQISSEKGVNGSVAQTPNSLSIIDTCNQNNENKDNTEDLLRLTSADDKISNEKFSQSFSIAFSADTTTISESLMNTVEIEEPLTREIKTVRKRRGRLSKVKPDSQIHIEDIENSCIRKPGDSLSIVDTCKQNLENQVGMKGQLNNELTKIKKERGRPSKVKHDNQIPTENSAIASIPKTDSSLSIVGNCNQNIENKDVTEEVPEVSPGDNILKEKFNESLSIQVDDIATTANEHLLNTVEFEVPLSNEVKILQKKKGRPSRFNSDNIISSEKGINGSVAQTPNSLSIIDTCNQIIENEDNTEDLPHVTSVDDAISNENSSQSLNITLDADTTTINESLMNTVEIEEPLNREVKKVQKRRGRIPKVKHDIQIHTQDSTNLCVLKSGSSLSIIDTCSQNLENQVEIEESLNSEVKKVQKRRGRSSKINHDNQIHTEASANVNTPTAQTDSSLSIIDTSNKNAENKDDEILKENKNIGVGATDNDTNEMLTMTEDTDEDSLIAQLRKRGRPSGKHKVIKRRPNKTANTIKDLNNSLEGRTRNTSKITATYSNSEAVSQTDVNNSLEGRTRNTSKITATYSNSEAVSQTDDKTSHCKNALKRKRSGTSQLISTNDKNDFVKTDQSKGINKENSSTGKIINLECVDNIKRSNDESENNTDNELNDSLPLKKRKFQFDIYKIPKRGRPKGSKNINYFDNDYLPHHSQSRHLPRSKNSKVGTSVKSVVEKMVVCGKCNVELARSRWTTHNLQLHNDLGWLEGREKLDYETNPRLVKRILFNAIKKRRGSLICEICNDVKRSVLGYLSHLTFCGKNEEESKALMVTCPVCKAVIKPSSIEYHERLHRMQEIEKQKLKFLEAENNELGSKMKRKAAEKAVTKISEFTALVKDNKDIISLDKKMKLGSNVIRHLIQKPQLTKRVSNLVLSKWKKDIDAGQNAVCNQIRCEFSSKSLDDMKEHYSKCNFKPQTDFICKICKFQTSFENEIVNHALKHHSIEDNNPDLSLSDLESYSSDSSSDTDVHSEKNPGSRKRHSHRHYSRYSYKMFKFLFKAGACDNKKNKIFLGAFQWTLDFERKNYKLNLFQEYVPNCFVLQNVEEAKKYLPELKQSMSMKCIKLNSSNLIESKWKKWDRFEGQLIKDTPTFFVGGPVWALAWLPLHSCLAFSENVSQFIAISTHIKMNAEYSVGKAYYGKNIIQIWSLGNLNHNTTDVCNPKLAYAIAHEGGTVWCLDWCPSGCYEHEDIPFFNNRNVELKRMGLLAAACSDGCIRVYSIIFPEVLHSCDDGTETIESSKNNCPVYKTEPVIILIVNIKLFDNKQQNWQATKVSWTKEKEHSVIAAGFSNGYVALWDLHTKSPMLRSKRNHTIYLNPYKHFLAHHHAVTMINLIPQDNKQFLATASLDRYYKFWDLEDITNSKQVIKKSFVTNGSWLNNWCSTVISYDDSLSLHHNYSYCIPLREYTYKYYNMFPTNSSSYAIAASDFGNSIANGTLAGEVLAMFPQELLYYREMEKTLPRKRLICRISSVEVVDLQDMSDQKDTMESNKQKKKNDGTINKYMPGNYDDAKDRFGIKFCDKMNRFKEECSFKDSRRIKKTLTSEMMESVPIEQYPFMSVNRVSWNPNAWSFLWLAVGYQNGFVRIIPFNFLASAHWNKILASHIDKMKPNANSSEIKTSDSS